MRIKYYIFIAIFSVTSQAIAEEESYQISLTEVLSLPPFCRAMGKNNFQPEAQQFQSNKTSLPGPHAHHFCHGMKYILRQNYKTAIKEFEYVEEHSQPGDRTLPVNALYTAVAYENLGKKDLALKYYQKSIALNPNYASAYSKLADFYKHQGNKDQAVQTIENGLHHIPNSKSLKKKLEKLNSGKNK